MFYVVYEMRVDAQHNDAFIDLWSRLTHFIRDHEGGMGSRLHRVEPGVFVAYAQWPDRDTWSNADGGNLPDEAQVVRQGFRDLGVEVRVVYELEPVKDLLTPIPVMLSG